MTPNFGWIHVIWPCLHSRRKSRRLQALDSWQQEGSVGTVRNCNKL